MGLRDSIDPQKRDFYFKVFTISIVVLVLTAGVILALNVGTDTRKDIQEAAARSDEQIFVDKPFDPNDPEHADIPLITGSPAPPTTEPVSGETVLPPNAEQAARSPEGTHPTLSELQHGCNQTDSGLSKDVYEKASNLGVELLRARTTGVSSPQFEDFLLRNSPMISLASVNPIYSCAERYDDDFLLVRTWWGGERLFNGGTITLAMTAVFVDREKLTPVPDEDLPKSMNRQDGLTTIFYDE